MECEELNKQLVSSKSIAKEDKEVMTKLEHLKEELVLLKEQNFQIISEEYLKEHS